MLGLEAIPYPVTVTTYPYREEYDDWIMADKTLKNTKRVPFDSVSTFVPQENIIRLFKDSFWTTEVPKFGHGVINLLSSHRDLRATFRANEMQVMMDLLGEQALDEDLYPSLGDIFNQLETSLKTLEATDQALWYYGRMMIAEGLADLITIDRINGNEGKWAQDIELMFNISNNLQGTVPQVLRCILKLTHILQTTIASFQHTVADIYSLTGPVFDAMLARVHQDSNFMRCVQSTQECTIFVGNFISSHLDSDVKDFTNKFVVFNSGLQTCLDFINHNHKVGGLDWRRQLTMVSEIRMERSMPNRTKRWMISAFTKAPRDARTALLNIDNTLSDSKRGIVDDMVTSIKQASTRRQTTLTRISQNENTANDTINNASARGQITPEEVQRQQTLLQTQVSQARQTATRNLQSMIPRHLHPYAPSATAMPSPLVDAQDDFTMRQLLGQQYQLLMPELSAADIGQLVSDALAPLEGQFGRIINTPAPSAPAREYPGSRRGGDGGSGGSSRRVVFGADEGKKAVGVTGTLGGRVTKKKADGKKVTKGLKDAADAVFEGSL